MTAGSRLFGVSLVLTTCFALSPAASQSVRAAGDEHDPKNAVAGLDVGPGLEATLSASEPMIVSLTNCDVDDKGRVWVCEVVNYRSHNGQRPEGDRIMILESTKGDGVMDKSTVFYQGRDVDSAMGICVLGNKIIVSASPNVLIFTNEGDKPVKKELLFAKTGQQQHDHSAHTFVFGPDGKLYWNFGNVGQAVNDKDGKPVIDLSGNTVVDNGKPYFGGMAFRCNLEGGDFEVLAHNFRNNYEVNVDSFGTIWQSDNDDDGNRGVRVNYVMEGGNYGYRDEFTGASWQTPRTGLEEDIPHRHWHTNDPGVVPNLLLTGAGSPTGIVVYEGDLLPKTFHNQIIHCDAGPSVVRSYPVTNDGAGYKAEIVNILQGTRDKWFRPVDVRVAPDGSVFVTDWYDPGVGGHGQGDSGRGRLYRLAPPGSKYTIPKFDYTTVEGAIEALKNPCADVRYLAWTSLHEMGAKAEAGLAKLFKESDNPRYRARALWLLSKLPEHGPKYLNEAIKDKDSDIRITAIRAARQLKGDIIPYITQLVKDESPQVRRECAIALRHDKSPEAGKLWAELAVQHDGKDRWYIEALGIGADRQWDAFFSAWQQLVGDKWDTAGGRDVIWRSRNDSAVPLLIKMIADPKVEHTDMLRYFRSLDFHKPATEQAGQERSALLTSLLTGNRPFQNEIRLLALERLGKVDIEHSPELKKAAEEALKSAKDPDEFLELIERLNIRDRYPQVLEVALKYADQKEGVRAIGMLLGAGQTALIQQSLASTDPEVVSKTVKALGNSTDARTAQILLPLVKDKDKPIDVRREATRALAQQKLGAEELIKMAKSGQLEEGLKFAAAVPLHNAPWKEIASEAEKLFPLPAGKDNAKLPPLKDLLKMQGDAKRGEIVFKTTGTCIKCHKINGEGAEVGPKLSEIGVKASRESLYESILYPSAAISHNFETWNLQLNSGNVATGIMVSQTPESVTIKGIDAIERSFKRSEIEELKKSNISLMPADLQKTMSAQELADVVEFLTTLKQEKK